MAKQSARVATRFESMSQWPHKCEQLVCQSAIDHCRGPITNILPLAQIVSACLWSEGCTHWRRWILEVQLEIIEALVGNQSSIQEGAVEGPSLDVIDLCKGVPRAQLRRWFGHAVHAPEKHSNLIAKLVSHEVFEGTPKVPPNTRRSNQETLVPKCHLPPMLMEA